jgi:hypothetical protein
MSHPITPASDEHRSQACLLAASLVVAVLCVLRLDAAAGPAFERLLAWILLALAGGAAFHVGTRLLSHRP